MLVHCDAQALDLYAMYDACMYGVRCIQVFTSAVWCLQVQVQQQLANKNLKHQLADMKKEVDAQVMGVTRYAPCGQLLFLVLVMIRALLL